MDCVVQRVAIGVDQYFSCFCTRYKLIIFTEIQYRNGLYNIYCSWNMCTLLLYPKELEISGLIFKFCVKLMDTFCACVCLVWAMIPGIWNLYVE